MGIESLLSIIVGIAAFLILISIALNTWNINPSQEKIEGSKQYVLNSILNLIYECFEKNYGRKESIICNKLIINSKEELNSIDIKNNIDSSRISKIEVEDLGSLAEIIIRYENEVIYVEKVENERISS